MRREVTWRLVRVPVAHRTLWHVEPPCTFSECSDYRDARIVWVGAGCDAIDTDTVDSSCRAADGDSVSELPTKGART